MALKDLTTFIEVDPDGLVTVTSSTVSYIGLRTRNATSLLYEAFTFPEDTPVTFEFEFQQDVGAGFGTVAMWGMADIIGDLDDWTSSANQVRFKYTANSSDINLAIREIIGPEVSNDNIASTTAIRYTTTTLNPSGGVSGKGLLTMKLYSDSSRSVLVDTLTVEATNLTVASYVEYLYALASNNSAQSAAQQNTGYTKDLDVVVGGVTTTSSTTTTSTTSTTSTSSTSTTSTTSTLTTSTSTTFTTTTFTTTTSTTSTTTTSNIAIRRRGFNRLGLSLRSGWRQ